MPHTNLPSCVTHPKAAACCCCCTCKPTHGIVHKPTSNDDEVKHALELPQEFVRILAAFSPRADREDRVRFLFNVYDMDGDGVVSREDLELMLRQLAGTSLR